MSENDLPAQDDRSKTVSRRRFLYLTGATGLVLAIARSEGTSPGEETADIALTATATRTLHLRRREDSLNLRIDLFNADLVRTSTGSGGLMSVVTTTNTSGPRFPALSTARSLRMFCTPDSACSASLATNEYAKVVTSGSVESASHAAA